MLNQFNKINQFYAWWVSSLLSCLPEKWFKNLTNLKSNFDLVITHRGGSIIIMTDQGKILDSISRSRKAEIDLEKRTSDETLVDGYSDGEMIGEEKLITNHDPLISLDPDSIDSNLENQKKEIN